MSSRFKDLRHFLKAQLLKIKLSCGILFCFFDELGSAMYPMLASNSQKSSFISSLNVSVPRALGFGFVCKIARDLYAKKDKVFFS